jgi:hypothetical protein
VSVSSDMLKAQIAAVAAALGAIANIGKVYDYVPAVVGEADFKQTFYDASVGKILGWTIARESTRAQSRGVHSDQDLPAIVIRGWMGVGEKGKTGPAFDELIETVRDELARKENRTLGGNAEWCERANVRLSTMGFFGSVLCHYCEIVLPVGAMRVTY